MKKSITASLLIATLASTSMYTSSAHAVEGLSANVGLTSNYLWRGVTQTDDATAISGGIDYDSGAGFYAGTWASNVDFGDDASYELDLYLGYAGDMGDVSYDVGYIYYAYPDSAEVDGDNEYDFGELYGSLGYDAFSLSVNYVVNNDDGADALDKALYIAGDAAFEISEGLELAFHVGSFTFDDDYDDADYVDYSVSLSKSGFTFTLSDTDIDDDDLTAVISYAIDIDL